VHRDIQREYGLASEVALTMPILVGLDGQRKMSKSLGNYVGITEPPDTMFGKLMSISDELMWSYYDLLTDAPSAELRAAVESGARHPMDVKMDLARRIVADFHGAAAGGHAAEQFQRVFRDREAPEDVPVRKIARGGKKKLAALLAEAGLVPSRAEAERLIKHGGAEIDGARVDDVRHEVDLSRPGGFLLRAGKKKFLRIVVE